MRFVIQVVENSKVDVDGKTVGSIGKGFMVLIGINQTDTKEIADKMIKKLLGLRIFKDENDKRLFEIDENIKENMDFFLSEVK